MFKALDTAAYWDEKYLNNEANWDLKSANPVFEDLIKQSEFVAPGKLLIAGCGRGYDAVMAAKYGYDVTAVDFSVSAVEFGKNLANNEAVNVNFLTEDIFLLDEEYFEQYDYVYEYVTYCAINPERREEYIKKISSLLKPSGKLIAFLFPTDIRHDGPPFGIDIKEFYRIASKYFKLEISTKKIKSIKPRAGREVLQIYIKP